MIIDYCEQLFIEKNIEREFWKIARKVMTPNPEKLQNSYLPIIKLLKRINPLPQIITTNIDNCLELTGEYGLNIYYRLEDFKGAIIDDLGIFHIHGYIEHFEDSLLTRKKYVKRYHRAEFRNFLKNFFKKYAVLFLGCSLRDNDILDFIIETNDPKKPHFLLASNDNDINEEIYSRSFGITVIRYGNHDNFKSTLETWINRQFTAKDISEIKDAKKASIEDV